MCNRVTNTFDTDIFSKQAPQFSAQCLIPLLLDVPQPSGWKKYSYQKDKLLGKITGFDNILRL